MNRYIHIKYLLRFIREKEKERFQIINSEDYGIKGENSFKIIIPLSFEVAKIKDNDAFDSYFPYIIIDKNGNSFFDKPYILFWNKELYSTEKEKSVCILDENIDEGFVMFNNFKNIPEFVESSEILKYVD